MKQVSPFKKPEKTNKRLKMLMYGTPGTGKTYTAIQFPNPAIIDTEKGAVNDQYVDILNEGNGMTFQTSDYDEMVNSVKWLLTNNHDYKTLIIDPITTTYNDLADKAEKKVGTDYGKNILVAKKAMKKLYNLLNKLDMNVIIIAHLKDKWKSKKDQYNNKSVSECVGETFDCWDKLEHLFDLVLKTEFINDKYRAFAEKSRIDGIPKHTYIELSYDEIAKRYGHPEMLKKKSENIKFATKDQISKIKNYVSVMKIDDDVIDKWFGKAEASCWEEFEEKSIQKCIDFLESKLKETKEEE